jgi:hypothetical protein
MLVPPTGVEPTTLSLGRICSIQLSYRGIHATAVQLDKACDFLTASLGQLNYRGVIFILPDSSPVSKHEYIDKLILFCYNIHIRTSTIRFIILKEPHMGKNSLSVTKRKTAERREERRDIKSLDRKALATAIAEREEERSNRFFILAGRDPETNREFPTHRAFHDAVDELGELSADEENLREVTDDAYMGVPSLMELLYDNDPFYENAAEKILQPAT